MPPERSYLTSVSCTNMTKIIFLDKIEYHFQQNIAQANLQIRNFLATGNIITILSFGKPQQRLEAKEFQQLIIKCLIQHLFNRIRMKEKYFGLYFHCRMLSAFHGRTNANQLIENFWGNFLLKTGWNFSKNSNKLFHSSKSICKPPIFITKDLEDAARLGVLNFSSRRLKILLFSLRELAHQLEKFSGNISASLPHILFLGVYFHLRSFFGTDLECTAPYRTPIQIPNSRTTGSRLFRSLHFNLSFEMIENLFNSQALKSFLQNSHNLSHADIMSNRLTKIQCKFSKKLWESTLPIHCPSSSLPKYSRSTFQRRLDFLSPLKIFVLSITDLVYGSDLRESVDQKASSSLCIKDFNKNLSPGNNSVIFLITLWRRNECKISRIKSPGVIREVSCWREAIFQTSFYARFNLFKTRSLHNARTATRNPIEKKKNVSGSRQPKPKNLYTSVITFSELHIAFRKFSQKSCLYYITESSSRRNPFEKHSTRVISNYCKFGYDGASGLKNILDVPIPRFELQSGKATRNHDFLHHDANQEAEDIWHKALKNESRARTADRFGRFQAFERTHNENLTVSPTLDQTMATRSAFSILGDLGKETRRKVGIAKPGKPTEQYKPNYEEIAGVKKYALTSWEAELQINESKAKDRSAKITHKKSLPTIDRRFPASWCRFPSHNRTERLAQEISLNDIKVRDFARVGFKDDEPVWCLRHDSEGHITNLDFFQQTKDLKQKLGKSAQIFLNKFKIQDEESRRTRGRRGSMTLAGELEFPELELLPGDFMTALQLESKVRQEIAIEKSRRMGKLRILKEEIRLEEERRIEVERRIEEEKRIEEERRLEEEIRIEEEKFLLLTYDALRGNSPCPSISELLRYTDIPEIEDSHSPCPSISDILFSGNETKKTKD